MRPIILLLTGSLIISGLVACVGVNKIKQNIVIYDFGLSVPNENNQQITSKILLEEPVAAESLNHNKIRYRLNYQNPARIFFYTESRWAANPSELLSSKLNTLINVVSNPMNCSLRLKIEAFDHVFQTATISEGVVQLSALLVEKKSNEIISNQLITASIAASTPNAQGGTAALNQASEIALKKAIAWGNMMAENNTLCR
ncbi:MAG: hypothetical protein A3I83_05470 [Methylotenera sp. RIFCSPLOWO2_02_FULL_45_14]|nr:MAG: hypothetical protein A3I83_05470 [Methylotenera sp. RIFCSPLOWO2_02_FULL_45_14]